MELDNITKKRSRFYSKIEIKRIMSIVNSFPNTKEGKNEAFEQLGKEFGVTSNAIYCKWYHEQKNKNKRKPKLDTVKIPVVAIKRKYKTRITNKQSKIITSSILIPELRSLTFDIQDVKVDLVNKKLTIIY